MIHLRLFLLVLMSLGMQRAWAQSVFINEIHYDNASTDVNEGFEIAGPAGTDLSCYKVILYNGANGLVSNTLTLSGTIPDQCNGFGTVWVPASMENGSPDGLALVFDPSLAGCSQSGSLTVLQFLSYEGVFTALAGDANGQSSTDIGVTESNSTPVGQSLQLTGNGQNYADFTWQSGVAATAGSLNQGQTFNGPCAAISATTLSFTQMTAGCTTPGQTFSVDVCATNASGTVDTNYTGTVTVSVASGPSGLTGTTSAALVNGCASLSGLSLAATGAYTFSASDGNLSGTSSSFYISSSCTMCPNLTGALIDACGAGEGRNEVLFFNSGDYAIPVEYPAFSLTYGPTSPPTTTYSNGFTSNLAYIDTLNTRAGCSIFVDALSNSPIPPQTAFMLMRSNPDYGYDYTAWCGQGPIYVLFTTDANWVEFGNFKNCTDCGVAGSGTTDRHFRLDISSLNSGAPCTFDYSYVPCTDLPCPGGGTSVSNGDGLSWAYGGGGPDSAWNECTPSAPTLLPVLYGAPLTATLQDGHTVLNWTTAQETNSSHFVVEHAHESGDFQPLGTVVAAGISVTPHPYRFVHSSPRPGSHLYRLRQVDLDGKSVLSRVVQVEIGAGESSRFQVIVQNRQESVRLEATGTGPFQFSLYTVDGKALGAPLSHELNGSETTTISTSHLPNGLYFYRARIGNERHSGKILLCR